MLDRPTDDECLDSHVSDCSGDVRYHSVDPGRVRAWPRCDRHWGDRLDRRNNSMEKYESSDVEPVWFDTAIAGESW